MADIVEDRVKETTQSTGAGNVTLLGALTGFRPFSNVCAVNDQCYIAIVAVDGNGNPTGAWEVSKATYISANTLRRDSVVSSSNNNQFVNFTAGVKQVYITFSSAQVKALQGVAPPSGGGGSGNPVPTGPSSLLYTGLTFQDEFNGTALDTTKWRPYIYYQSNQSGNPNNYDVNGGNLRIWPQVNTGGSFFQRTIVTDGLYTQLYGFFEMEAKLCKGAGTWPAFWLFNNDQHEIDIMEAYGNNDATGWGTASYEPNNFGSTVHRDGNNQVGGTTAAAAPALSWTYPVLSDAFHKYGCHWDSSKVEFWFDGIKFFTVNHGGVMNVPMYILLDIWYGSAAGSTNPPSGSVPATPQGNTNSFAINYVRAWQLA